MKKLKLLAALLALTVGLAGCGAGTASTQRHPAGGSLGLQL